ncbi:MAG: hypothetical protein JWN44_4170, partial [Myxococcales bacterium]|nr:hypothetical protein [Myxococcales bacterium]
MNTTRVDALGMGTPAAAVQVREIVPAQRVGVGGLALAVNGAMRTVALALALVFALAPAAAAKQRHAPAKHAKKASKHAKRLVSVSKSRPTRVASVEQRTSLPEVATVGARPVATAA